VEWLITGGVTAIALLLAMSRSPYLVDLTVYVFVFNRGLRRIVDYYVNHQFNPLSRSA